MGFGLATATAERIVATGSALEVARMRITKGGGARFVEHCGD
jgi:hypothetical protein